MYSEDPTSEYCNMWKALSGHMVIRTSTVSREPCQTLLHSVFRPYSWKLIPEKFNSRKYPGRHYQDYKDTITSLLHFCYEFIFPFVFRSVVAQSCPTLCDPTDCSLPGFSVHGIFQAIVLEWIAISFSRGSFQPRAQTRVSHIVDRRFTVWATREVQVHI